MNLKGGTDVKIPAGNVRLHAQHKLLYLLHETHTMLKRLVSRYSICRLTCFHLSLAASSS